MVGVAVVAVLALGAAACGDDDGSSSDSTGGGGAVSGDVNISGSSTVAPITSQVADQFADIEPDVVVNVDGPGTGDGFVLFCDGETDISDASRPIKDEEAQACADNGIDFIELQVGFDGITVMTSPDNSDVTCLTFADLYALVGPESQGFSSWSDAQALATELGSSTELPDAPLDITAPGEESGTYDSFIELALKGIADARVDEGKISEDEATTTRPDYTSQADDNAIIQAMEGSSSSFGWVGFAFAEEAADQIKEIEIDGGDGCTSPSAETIADGSYPLSRSLYIYVNAAKAEENPAVAAFVDYYVGDGIGAVTEVGYVALPDDDIAATASRWADRTTGTASS
jgi:phosphate transport system substrate-binding protein